MNNHRLGFFFALLAALTNSINPIFIKWATSVPNEIMVFIRCFVSLLFVMPGVFTGKVVFRSNYILKHVWRALVGLGGIYCYFYSVKVIPIVDAITLQNTTPLFMPLLVFFVMKLLIPKLEILALILGFLGVLLILRPGVEIENWGCAIAVFGGLLGAFAQLGIRELSKVESVHTMMVYYFLISAVVSFLPMVFAWQPIDQPILWVWIIAIGVTNLATQYFKTKSLVYAPATKVGTMIYLEVVFSGFVGWWLFDQVPSYWAIGGIALIIAGGLLALFCTKKAYKWGKKKD